MATVKGINNAKEILNIGRGATIRLMHEFLEPQGFCYKFNGEWLFDENILKQFNDPFIDDINPKVKAYLKAGKFK